MELTNSAKILALDTGYPRTSKIIDRSQEQRLPFHAALLSIGCLGTTASTSMDQPWEIVLDHDTDRTAWNNWEGFVHAVQTQNGIPNQEANREMTDYPIF